jgi:hypothetical protein
MVGASQVFLAYGPPADVAGLIESERVTVTAGVPTVCSASSGEMRRRRPSTLRGACGESAMPKP